MTDPVLLLVAHGTRNPAGVETIARLADAVSVVLSESDSDSSPGPSVRVAFVDVLGPSPADVLRDLPADAPVIAVPAFLASGYHVHADLPREITESGHRHVHVTPAIGPDPALARVLGERLRDTGLRPTDRVVLAAAGSSDVRALADVRTAADQLETVVGRPVEVAYVATGEPRVAGVVATARAEGDRVVVASYLLAPGLFHTRLGATGAAGVTEPLGVHPGVTELVVARYRAGVDLISAAAARSRPHRSAPGRD
ncbi:sirohydrochlorin chelatase [Rhodococcoides kroppenstedtii]|uniref:sirohydrochlorin chelatase n=1 Tax=Rhodococcoides kroppenstedtii TaxID=293050 RepID=UPI0028E6BDA6|nr:sirohydrochlorin chelatase [Rhodococcus kroppenstedtii]